MSDAHDIPLTDDERKAIAALERLAKRWPQSLTLFSWSGTLHETTRRAWRRHFGIAARVAAGAFYTDEDKMRLAAEAIGRGEFIGCNPPEVPGA